MVIESILEELINRDISKSEATDKIKELLNKNSESNLCFKIEEKGHSMGGDGYMNLKLPYGEKKMDSFDKIEQVYVIPKY